MSLSIPMDIQDSEINIQSFDQTSAPSVYFLIESYSGAVQKFRDWSRSEEALPPVCDLFSSDDVVSSLPIMEIGTYPVADYHQAEKELVREESVALWQALRRSSTLIAAGTMKDR